MADASPLWVQSTSSSYDGWVETLAQANNHRISGSNASEPIRIASTYLSFQIGIIMYTGRSSDAAIPSIPVTHSNDVGTEWAIFTKMRSL